MAEVNTKEDESAWWFILSQGKLVALDKGDFIPLGASVNYLFPMV
ncbi:hypothetical protein [Psychromonas sp. KJ10-2]